MDIIDIHTHGIGGHDTKGATPDDILKVAEIHGRHGVSSIIPTIYPAAVNTMRKEMEAVKKAMQCQKKGARIAGLHLEGPFLNPLQPGALDKKSFLKPDKKTLKGLVEGFEDVVKIITVAPELEGSINFIKAISDMGIIVSMGHSDATYEEAEKGYNAGARGITHIFNAMRGFNHRQPGIAGFGLLNKHIYIEVISDPFHLHKGTVELIFKLKNPKRIIIVSDSTKETLLTKHHAISDMAGRLRGGAFTITASTKRLIKAGFDENMVMKCISDNPSSYLCKMQ